MNNSGESKTLVLIIILGCSLRLFCAFWVPNEYSQGTNFPDSYHYVSVARNVATNFQYANSWRNPRCHQCFGDIGVTSFREPLYPLLLALQFKLFGDSTRTTFVIQALLGTLTIPLCFGAAAMLLSSRAALLGALLESINPYHLYYASFISSENVTTIILMTLVFFTLRVIKSMDSGVPSRKDLLLLVLCVSAGILTRAMFISIALVTFFFVAYAYYCKFKGYVAPVRVVSALVLLTGVFVSPWFIRNYFVWHTFVYQTNAGQNLVMGFNDRATGNNDDDSRLLELDLAMAPYGYNEIERNQIYKQYAIAWIQAHPGRAIYLAVRKQLLFWSPVPATVRGYQKLIGGVWGSVFLAFTLIGLITMRNRSLANKYLLALVVVYSLFHSIPMAITRYRVPLEGVLTLFAGYGLSLFLTTLQSRVKSYLST
jgi:4-amino-4-deoxy-L-arabinose transferase-like glycosyltransferase